MDGEIQVFISYLRDVKRASRNTIMSYQSDLMKMCEYAKKQGVCSVAAISPTILNSYVLELEKSDMAASTISRYIASMKAFFEFMVREHRLMDDPSYHLKPPKVERKVPGILTVQEMELILEQPDLGREKGIRDKAMLELLYATGMRASELVALRMEDVNLRFGWVICSDEDRQRMIPFGIAAAKAMMSYLEESRKCLVKGKDEGILFLNCSGKQMSRQGFWKILKSYAEKAGIQKEITPRMFRHSCAAHMAANGARLQTIQELLGHTDLSATQVYAAFQTDMKNEYSKVHPRG